MKRIIYVLIALLLLGSCGVYQTVDFNRVTLGMSKGEVRSILGSPERILAVNRTMDGLQEVLQYRTPYDEVYALEFWNDRLTGYEFLYEDIQYVPRPVPPPRPPYGQPIFPNYRPPANRPPANRPPNRPEKPTPPRPVPPNRPGNNERPPVNDERPGIERPGGNTRPSVEPPRERPTTRPVETERPTTRPAPAEQDRTPGSGRR